MASLEHWHILGAGSIGCLWASYLLEQGHQISLIAKNEQHQKALLSTRLRCHTLDAQVIPAEQNQAKIEAPNQQSSINNLLICLKAHTTQNAIEAIGSRINNSTNIVLMQNGMGNGEWLKASLPNNPIYLASTTEAALSHSTLNIQHTGRGKTLLGQINGPSKDINKQLNCKLELSQIHDIETVLWKKLIINCCINPLTVKYDCLNGELAFINEAQDSIKVIIQECVAVANAKGITLDEDEISRQVKSVIKNTASNSSSMRQDVLQQRKTEIDYINGFIVSTGKGLGIDTEENATLLKYINQLHHATTSP